MFKKILFFLILISISVKSQHTISGEMNPINEDLTWVAIYQLKGAKQTFIGNSTISNGKFTVEIPVDQTSGMYRLRYKMDNKNFVDFIYSKEDIALTFDPNNPTQSVDFLNSSENKLYNSYLHETHNIRRQLDSIQYTFFSLKTEDEKKNSISFYKKTLASYKSKQKSFQKESRELFASHLIKASEKFYKNEPIAEPQEYLNSEREHYFDFVDFNDNALKNASFFNETVLRYVFNFNKSEDFEVQNAFYKNAVNSVMSKIGANDSLKSKIIITLLYSFAQNENLALVDFIIEKYYNKQEDSLKNEEDLQVILDEVKLAIGKTAPDFSWKEKDEHKSLFGLNTKPVYILVFWSTDCSHCLIEVPQLYDFTKNNENVHVIGFALENNELGFNYHTLNFIKWTNILGLNKWQNPTAKSYDIVSTPTYFILDSNKKIIAKPNSIQELKSFFKD